MADLKLTASHDLDISSRDAQLLTGRDETAQRLTISYSMYKGEWFLDARVGMPYYEQIFVKNPQIDIIKAIYRRMAEADDAVDSVGDIVVQYDAAARDASIDMVVTDTDGNTIEFNSLPIVTL